MKKPSRRAAPEYTGAVQRTRHVVLIGLMGSGKTTIGRVLARRLGRPFVDNDEVLERMTGKQASAIESSDGADVLHRREADALRAALDDTAPAVVAAAAAAAVVPDLEAPIERNVVVYLRAGAPTLADRVAHKGDGHRPFLDEDLPDLLARQYARRDPTYRKLADVVVDTDHGDPDALVAGILEQIDPMLTRD